MHKSDKVIIHGLWPDAELTGSMVTEEVAWRNQLLIDDGNSPNKPWVLYKYISSVLKKTDREKDNERIVKITILEYVKKLTAENIINNSSPEDDFVNKLMDIYKEGDGDDEAMTKVMDEIQKEITGENDKKRSFDRKQSTTDIEKMLKAKYHFKFKCIKSKNEE